VSQDPATFYWEVYDLVNGDLDRKIMLLCRTGSRSVRAGNILANPADPDGDPLTPTPAGLENAPAFTNVYNIWEGFVGLYRYEFTGSPPAPNPLERLDLNGDGLINDDFADVYTERTDANPDKDGWRNFAGLPWTTKIRRPLAYMQDPGQYDALVLTPVQ
jgi:hypothetical protein